MSDCGNQWDLPGIGRRSRPNQHNSRGTLLYDAVYLSAHDMLAKEVGARR